MEKATRRLTILSSHLRQTRFNPVQPVFGSPSSSSSSDPQNPLTHSLNHNFQHDCVFCKIIRGDAPSFKLYEDDTCICILDTNPLSHGHSLIIPKSHFPSLDVTPPSVIASMCSKVPSISNAIMKATGCNSFNMLVNNGKAAGQVIFHTHIHVIPRKAYDCLWTSESLRRLPLNLNEETSQLAARVQEQMLPSKVSHDGKHEDYCSNKG
ncbi:hypothetical protein Lal_00011228 [Lupinus albus]|uniref:Putative adenylylsulfatase n=1 Tax=Lupinus albus TaxID=3870 RepID=A0A6A5NQF1_LUPAL|nr:putative adenylylsulfatase [Lupinus albus]KAF1888457.1 hypothetical protein Lal_00011228 [Lupinus albus]